MPIVPVDPDDVDLIHSEMAVMAADLDKTERQRTTAMINDLIAKNHPIEALWVEYLHHLIYDLKYVPKDGELANLRHAFYHGAHTMWPQGLSVPPDLMGMCYD